MCGCMYIHSSKGTADFCEGKFASRILLSKGKRRKKKMSERMRPIGKIPMTPPLFMWHRV
ncbi:hypothetical protein CSUI_008705 [Cystoisospora suis]|uniref:Uncharacterized protein n=1 Tax=Cystoisospora suis TaxID=483139 RepID=A0A2C6KLW1_9APIC|nr:hypothetical protein CSUI_008705 [Cystoisospora suis]